MDSLTYERYLTEWLVHKSREMHFLIPTSITDPILSHLYRTYRDFVSKKKSCNVHLIREKFIYDRTMHRHGFHCIFRIKNNQGQVENVKLITYIHQQSQKILHKYRQQFQLMATAIFGDLNTHKLNTRKLNTNQLNTDNVNRGLGNGLTLKIKIQCESKTGQFRFLIRILEV